MITIRSIHKRWTDSKTFSIHCTTHNTNQLKEIAETHIQTEQESGELQELIYLTGENKQVSTHVIQIKERHKKNPCSRSFRIRNPSYSAAEIAESIKIKLTGTGL